MNLITITGFRAFPGVADNPTQRVIEHFANTPAALPQGTALHLLDVDYRKVVPQLDRLLANLPRALILTGYSNLATTVTLESRATAMCAADKPDNAGYVPPLAECEPPPLNTMIDLSWLQKALLQRDISADISADAGQYLCNFSYHYALRQIAERGISTRVLFVHLPAVTGSELAKSAAASMPMAKIAAAISIIAENLAE